jgi:hypothetical protein
MVIMVHELPAEFHAAYHRIHRLARYPRYLGALIFGSVAKGHVTPAGDLDVKVIVDRDNPCSNVNHPPLHPTKKVDLTCVSLAQLQAATDRELAQGERQPLIAGARIIFDKTGQIGTLIECANSAQPKPFAEADRQLTHFLVYHANDKAARYVETEPAAALLVMHISFNDLLKLHYRLQRKWWVSDKWLLADLRSWDPALAALVEAFVVSASATDKFAQWSAVIDHIVRPLGGRQSMTDNNCTCAVCQADLSRITGDIEKDED